MEVEGACGALVLRLGGGSLCMSAVHARVRVRLGLGCATCARRKRGHRCTCAHTRLERVAWRVLGGWTGPWPPGMARASWLGLVAPVGGRVAIVRIEVWACGCLMEPFDGLRDANATRGDRSSVDASRRACCAYPLRTSVPRTVGACLAYLL
jgi:hypothetical protein